MTTIEKRVMASVGIIYAAYVLVSGTALKVYALVLSGWTLVQLTWVHKVFENWAHVGLSGTFQFVTYAVMHTHLAVQLTLAVLLVAGVMLARDMVRSLAEPRLQLV